MALKFGSAKGDDVATLIARKNYAKAIAVIKAQLKEQGPDQRLRLQLSDVLVSAGKNPEAIQILLPLADEFARDGFAAKAISVLKKIQKVDPGRRDVERKLAGLIEEKQRFATVSLPSASAGFPEIGIEEIGFEPPAGGPITVPAAEAEPRPAGVQPGPAAAKPAEAELSFTQSAEPLRLESDEPKPSATPASGTSALEDQDLLGWEGVEETGEDFVLLEPGGAAGPGEGELPLEAEPLAEEPGEDSAPAEPMSDESFAEELFSVLDAALREAPAEAAGSGPEAGSQIVVSPLFKDFSVDELVAVIQGLKLLTFEPRQVILREGEPGDSLYMLSSGTVKAFVKDARSGRQVPVSTLKEGAFFGEVSMLTGRPRSASVVAATRCELLELDRATLDSIVATHPHVLDVMKEFARRRVKAL